MNPDIRSLTEFEKKIVEEINKKLLEARGKVFEADELYDEGQITARQHTDLIIQAVRGLR